MRTRWLRSLELDRCCACSRIILTAVVDCHVDFGFVDSPEYLSPVASELLRCLGIGSRFTNSYGAVPSSSAEVGG